MKLINITRSGSQVTFQAVSIDTTENVVFSNQDTQEAHWPTLTTCTNQLGKARSPNSSECPVPVPTGSTLPYPVTYGCRLHTGEQGTITVYAQLAVYPPLANNNNALANAIVNQPIAVQQVVSGGQAPYTISGQIYQLNGGAPVSGSGIGPGLQVNPGTSAQGITVSGAPTVVGTYAFTFTVNDSMGRNLQQTQYTMTVSAA